MLAGLLHMNGQDETIGGSLDCYWSLSRRKGGLLICQEKACPAWQLGDSCLQRFNFGAVQYVCHAARSHCIPPFFPSRANGGSPAD